MLFTLGLTALYFFTGWIGCLWCSEPALPQWNELSEWSYFSVRAPLSFVEHFVRNDGSIAFTTYDTGTIKRLADDVSIVIYPSLPYACTPEVIGVSDVTRGNGGYHAIWGKVDYYDSAPYNIGQLALCTLPQEYPNPSGVSPLTRAAYGLCSRKDDKTVVICIAQMTDDPQLADEVFGSFRWTD